MSASEIVAVSSILLCLVLAWSSLKAQRLSVNAMLGMAAAWVAIFLAGVAIVSWMLG
jgi:hypothetical protein